MAGPVMSDTPKVDAFLRAENCSRDNPAAFDWLVGFARSLERELASDRADAQQRISEWSDLCEKADRENAELSDQLMRWFKAASPYATPGSLESALRRFHHWEEEIVRLLGIDPKDAGSLPDDVRSRKTDSGHPHRE
jgi:predicted O-linked N-acetylglucosamine transferase (SPINDLY family)